jgi:disulfide bond formation protein DsbB
MSDTVPLSVKWGKETFTLDFIVAGGVKGLKTELEEKTRVPADRMKLMAKSKGEIGKKESTILSSSMPSWCLRESVLSVILTLVA